VRTAEAAMRRLIGCAWVTVACSGPDDTVTGSFTSGSSSYGDADTDVDTDSDSDSDADTDTTVPTAPYGLGERPPNPTCVATDVGPLSGGDVALERAFDAISFSRPVWMGQIPGDGSAWFVAEQYNGKLFRFENDEAVTVKTLVLDVKSLIESGNNEGGLLGAVFHPDFASNGYAYLSFTRPTQGGEGGHHTSEVARFHSSDGGLTLDPTTRTPILEIPHPEFNHNGGNIAFGPDGMLYFGLGDGGSGGDPWDNAQDTSVLLGKMLRIDVDGGDPYGIPADNPFASGVSGAPEIFAWGLRNPWRFVFDAATGDLWVGDVGQNDWEEVDLVELGGNYGWNELEGTSCYGGGCDPLAYKGPFATYENTVGASVVMGPVYRGTAIPELIGVPLYIDYSYGDLWGLFFNPVTGLPAPRVIANNTGRKIATFAEDPEDGTVYAVDHSASQQTGIWRVVAAAPPVDDPFPALLSETGCFEPADPTVPVAGLIPYDINHGFWSDGADKRRWMAVPDGAVVTEGDGGDLDFPVGSVLVKEFTLLGTRVETRLLMRHADGTWGGYAYQWREDGSEADLLAASQDVDVDGVEWTIPSRAECSLCHTAAAGNTLGLTTGQLDRVVDYAGVAAPQLATLEHIGLFAAPLAPADTMPAAFGPEPLDERARAWLDVNCAQCHRPDTWVRVALDLRRDTDLASSGMCAVPEVGTLGIPGALVVTPGSPEASVLSSRIHRRDAWGMPPIASNLIDVAGAGLVDDWITSLASCP
jgi:uncharacterized repeat protein (TIGR03806 family)